MKEPLLQKETSPLPLTMMNGTTFGLLLSVVIAVLIDRMIAHADQIDSSPRTLSSIAACPRVRPAGGSPGGAAMWSAVRERLSPGPRTATTQTGASSVTTPIRTVRKLVFTLTSPAPTPVSPCNITCVRGSTGAGRIMKSVALILDVTMKVTNTTLAPALPRIIASVSQMK